MTTQVLKIKYQRTSTAQQHGDRFKTDKEIYNKVFFDQGISGTKPFAERTEAKKVIELVNQGLVDELVVEEIRDIGRNMVDTINTLDWLDKNNVNVVIRSMGNLCSRVNGKRNEIWTLITATMSSLYQMELENLKIRTKMGREAYLMKGGVIGRPRFTKETEKTFLEKPKTKEIISLLKNGKSLRDIAGRAKCSINLVVKVKRLLEPTQVENMMEIAQ
jgi:DNA invertase Pin-like site-specific DNA recombinase